MMGTPMVVVVEVATVEVPEVAPVEVPEPMEVVEVAVVIMTAKQVVDLEVQVVNLEVTLEVVEIETHQVAVAVEMGLPLDEFRVIMLQ